MYRNTYDLWFNRHGRSATGYAQPTTCVISTIRVRRRPSYATGFGLHSKLREFLIPIDSLSIYTQFAKCYSRTINRNGVFSAE
jgi:hypothetical protein